MSASFLDQSSTRQLSPYARGFQTEKRKGLYICIQGEIIFRSKITIGLYPSSWTAVVMTTCCIFNLVCTQALQQLKSNPPEIPIVIGGKEIQTGNVKAQVSVSRVLCMTYLACVFTLCCWSVEPVAV